MSKSQSTRISGTKEWSNHSVNCISGCSHNCRYCYARSMAHRFGRIKSQDEWADMKVKPAEVTKRRRKLDGRVMFPTTHDITPETLAPCKDVLLNILAAGNEVLIVSKPHIECIETLCRDLKLFRDRILFRFTIGSRNESILAYWEPGAPTYEERLACLRLAHKEGYATSVSCEPILDTTDAKGLCDELSPHVTDSIWIGKMNKVRSRATLDTSCNEINRIEQGQTRESVIEVYGRLKDNPLVKWKESYKEVVGVNLARQAGLDI